MGRIAKSRSKKMKLKASKMADLIREDLDDPDRAYQLHCGQPLDVDLPGLGQFYCIECDRYFISTDVLAKHQRSKVHKTRVRRLREQPYTIEESVMASGMAATDRGLRPQRMAN